MHIYAMHFSLFPLHLRHYKSCRIYFDVTQYWLWTPWLFDLAWHLRYWYLGRKIGFQGPSMRKCSTEIQFLRI